MRRRRVWLGFGCALWLACAGPGFDYEDLPEEPIWMVYRTRDETERIAELMARAKEKPRPRRADEGPRFRLEDFGAVLGLGPTLEDRAADLLGRLAFIDPRTREITTPPFAKRGSRPLDVSPDGRQVLFLTLRRGSAHVFEYRVDTGDVVALTHGKLDELDACYGPGGRIAFVRRTALRADRPGGYRVFLWEPGGGAAQPLTEGPADHRPAWSPDGEFLIYQTIDSAGGEALARVDLEGDRAPKLLARGIGPSFTPDGEWVVYTARTRAGLKLWKMHPDGTGKRRLGSSPHDESDPAVSPDGRFVVFVSVQEDRNRLVVRSMDGRGGDRPLITNGEGLRPVW